MGKTIVIDGHEYKEREDGLYQTDTPYEVTSEWMDAPEHLNMAVIVLVEEAKDYAVIVSLNARSSDGISKVNKVAADMRKQNPVVEVMWALTDDDNAFHVGWLERAED